MRRRGRRIQLTPLSVAALVATTLLLALVVAGPIIWGGDAEQIEAAGLLQGPSSAHPFGTDALGRDILDRVLAATRLSVGLAALAIALALAVGVPLGAARAVLGPRAARWLGAAIDLLVAFPPLLAALFLAVVFGVGARGAVLAIGLASAPGFARLTMTLTDRVVASDYFAAARVLGVSRRRLVLRHVLPNIAEPLTINATVAIGQALMVLAGLSFLGLGVQPPAYDWGRMLNEGLARIYESTLPALAPGLAIVLAGLTFNLAGEAIAQVLGRRRPSGIRRRPRRAAAASHVAAPDRAPAAHDEVLHLERLSVRFPGTPVDLAPVRDVSLSVRAGEIVGVVGESGSGKSLSMLAAMRLTAPPAEVDAAAIRVLGRELRGMRERDVRELLGRETAMVFQDPATTLNPALRVGTQVIEPATVHGGASRRAALVEAARRLERVHLPDPARVLRAFPHQLSGGMRQRAMIAMGLMVAPRLIVADEPTTALDVTVQQQILRLLRELNEQSGVAVVFISHDIGAVAELCDRVLVMYCGRVVEELDRALLERDAAHPYTRALIASLPTLASDREHALATIPGQPPEPVAGIAGCPFAPRCASASERCRAEDPPLERLREGHRVACWHPRADANGERRLTAGRVEA